MTSLSDIMTHAWNKDSVNLKTALDAVMTDRISDQIEAMRTSITSGMFNPPAEIEVNSDEGSQDVNV
jgi:hypothetical protein